ncbi:MAG: trypsin-like peptidase domain-containing protein [Luteolibacter sp.]
MSPAFRRLLALLAVFIAAFLTVALLRTWRNGGDLKSLLPGFKKETGSFQPEKFTLPEKSALDLGQMELMSRLNDEYARLTDAVVPSVVSIDTSGERTEQLQDMWGRIRVRRYPTQGQGSGVIVTKEGHIVTNHHVISGQETIRVTFHNGKTYKARFIGEDNVLDIAVLKIDSDESFTPLTFGDSSQVQVGQIVFAVGNPFGLGETVTQGIISAKERSISENQRDLFQTDAEINPGNSGGPLVNLRGEIIGINAAIYSTEKDKENSRFQGVGFSIPANEVKKTLLQILERGRPVRGYLGVNMQGMLPVVAEVTPDSPAQAAGLQPRDRVVSWEGVPVHSCPQLIELVRSAKIGESIHMVIERGGEEIKVKVTIAESPTGNVGYQEIQPDNSARARKPLEVLQTLGVEVRDVTVPERQLGYQGAVVKNVLAAGTAAGKIQPGDLVLKINNSQINSAREFYISLAASAAVQDTTLTVSRDGREFPVTLPAVPRADG